MKKIMDQLFLVERASIGLSLFRIAVALATGFHVIPTFFQMGENYLPTAFREYNAVFFTVDFLQWVAQSPVWLIYFFVGLFYVSCFFMLIGFLSQLSCILMTASCYYFYALNSFQVGTLSWDILLVTLFLMCMTPYHGDYFSLDCLLWGKQDAYKRKRPYFIQRLLQVQVGFTYFYTALYKITAEGNWLKENVIFYLMHNPPSGVTKLFLVRDFLKEQPQLCFVIGILIVVVELLMPFLLFWRKTRLSAVYLGMVFHVMLILTLDVPAIFFFLFPPQLLLFINPNDIEEWIEQKRTHNLSCAKRNKLIFDGKCGFCLDSVRKLKIMDLFATLEYVDFHQVENIKQIHSQLTKEDVNKQLYLIEPSGRLYPGFMAFRRLCFLLPMLYPMAAVLYFPGMGVIGPPVYRFIAKNRHRFKFLARCKDDSCQI